MWRDVCKKSGCDYLVSDFESIKLDVIDKALQTGRVSIVAALSFDRIPNGKLICNPLLYLRARNKNRGVIDLFSFKTTCASLTENGCFFDLNNRPGAGAALIPEKDRLCHSNIDAVEEVKKWLPYQSIFRKLVKRYTGKSVEEKLKENVEDVFYRIFTKDFEGVMRVEVEDVLGAVNYLGLAFPEEVLKAHEKVLTKKKKI